MHAFCARFPPLSLLEYAKQQKSLEQEAPKSKLALANSAFPETSATKWQPPKLVFEDVASLHKALVDSAEHQALKKLTRILRAYKRMEKAAQELLQ